MRWLPVAAGLPLLVGAVGGCSLGHSAREAGPSAPASQTVVPSSSPYVVVPSDTATTAPGTALKVGQTATVGWKAPKAGVTGVLGITVTALKKTTFDESFDGWDLSKDTLATAPYFVEAKVTNLGDTDLGGYAVPLYGLDAKSQLVEASSFKQSFAPCHPDTFPSKFGPGASASVCLVYLVPDQGKLVGASYRPDESLAPITWSGPVQPLKSSTKSSSKSGQKSTQG